MSTLPPCPQCNSAFTYEDAGQLICPECGHEWQAQVADAADMADAGVAAAAGKV